MQEIIFRWIPNALLPMGQRAVIFFGFLLGVLWLCSGLAFFLDGVKLKAHYSNLLLWPWLGWLVWFALGCICIWLVRLLWLRVRRQPVVLNEQHALLTPTEQELLHYAISHDLRAPLRVIDGFARILKEEEGPRMGRMSNEHLDRLLAAAERMNTMIDAVLTQAQLTQSDIKQERVDLSALAQHIANELAGDRQYEWGQTPLGGRVRWTLAPGMVATGDPNLLRRVLENLMGNAVKYSSKVPHPEVEVGMIEATNPKVFFVRDNGAGFNMQYVQKLFGLFQRLHSSKEFPGSGVGLAGVQIIVRRHGGRIWAEAQPDKGACFYFTLPGPKRL